MADLVGCKEEILSDSQTRFLLKGRVMPSTQHIRHRQKLRIVDISEAKRSERMYIKYVICFLAFTAAYLMMQARKIARRINAISSPTFINIFLILL
jgi:hypothetical protein